MGACSDQVAEPTVPATPSPLPPPPPSSPVETYTYLALGDSYTIGQGVEEASRWPNQLRDSLAQDSILLEEVNFIAQTGWTTRRLLDEIQIESPPQHDLVSLLIGVNNQFQRLPFSQFTSEFDSLLTIAEALAQAEGRVFVVSIPDYGVTPFGAPNRERIAEELDDYNAYIAYRCGSRDIPFINITEISRELGASEGALAFDNLHPSGFQYSLWVEEILPTVEELLKE